MKIRGSANESFGGLRISVLEGHVRNFGGCDENFRGKQLRVWCL